MADLLRQSEENGNRLQSLEADARPGCAPTRSSGSARARAAHQRGGTRRRCALRQQPTDPAAGHAAPSAKPAGPKPKAEAAPARRPNRAPPAAAAATDPGEDAYTEGFHLWEAGQYDQAITSLRAFTAAYPKHRRVSYANNLIGRSLLDKGDARAAAAGAARQLPQQPEGERAPDSLFYLGQALMKLGQPGQACKAYAELDAVYGAKIRADLKKQVADGEARRCRRTAG